MEYTLIVKFEGLLIKKGKKYSNEEDVICYVCIIFKEWNN